MSARGYMTYIVRSIVPVGRPAGASRSGCKEPQALDMAGYAELSQAAPLTPAELAATLSGRRPFDPEPGDDLSIVEDWKRILARVDVAIQRGELPAMPTWHEGITWARKVGLPIIDGGPDGGSDVQEANSGTTVPEKRRASDFDPRLQALAEEEGRRLLAQGREAPKKTVADNIKKTHKLMTSLDSIIRRTRHTWSRQVTTRAP